MALDLRQIVNVIYIWTGGTKCSYILHRYALPNTISGHYKEIIIVEVGGDTCPVHYIIQYEEKVK